MTPAFERFVLLDFTLLSFFLVALFWSLYRQVGRNPLFRWWAWAWAACGLYYGAVFVEISLPADLRLARYALVLVEALSVYARAPLLLFGALSFAAADGRTERWRRWYGTILSVTMAIGALVVGWSLSLEPEALAGYLRNLPRVALTAAALAYAGVVFFRHWHALRSRAALVTALATGAGAAIDVLFVAGILTNLHRDAGTAPFLFTMDAMVLWAALELLTGMGMALGMVYLLLEAHQRTTSAVRLSDLRYRAFVSGSTEGIWRGQLDVPVDITLPVDRQAALTLAHMRIVEANEALAGMLGMDSAAALLGRSLADVLAPDDEINAAFLRRYVQDGHRATDAESHGRDQAGGTRVFLNNVSGIVERGHQLGAWGTVRDVTEARRAEQARREADERYGMLVQTMSEGLMVTDLRERIEFVNDRCSAMLGYPHDALVGMTTLDLLATAADADTLRGKAELRRRGLADRYEVALHSQTGQTIWVQVSGAPMRDARGDVVGTIGILTDITERKQAEAERDKLFLLSIDLLATVSEDGRFLHVNPAFERVLGYRPSDLEGRPLLDLVVPDDRAATREQSQRLREGHPIISFENRCRCKDGSYRWLSWNVALPDAGVAYVVARDVTERRRADEDLARQRAFLREVIDVIPSFIFLKDAEGRYVLANRMHAEVYGRTADEMVGLTDADIHGEAADVAAFQEADRQVLSTGRDLVIPRLMSIGPNGRHRWSQVIKRRMLGLDGRPLVLGVAMDITETVEAELRQAAVYRIAQAASQSHDLEALFRSVHEIVQEVISARNFYIALQDADSGTVSFPYWVDERDERPAPRTDGDGLTEYVLRTRRPLLCTDEVEETLLARGAVQERGARSRVWAGVPLLAGDHALGVMAVQDYTDALAYGEHDVQILEFVATQLAKAIERRMVETARARLQEDVALASLEWQATFNVISSLILVLDREGRVIRMNTAALRATGHGDDGALGQHVGDVGEGEPWRRAAELVAAVCAGSGSATATTRDADTGRTWDVSAHLLTVEAARPTRVILVARDVSRLVELQDSLRRGERLSAMGALVGGVAHEVRNPLFSMTATLDAFEARYGTGDAHGKYLAVLRTQLDRLTTLMQDLLEYGKPRSLERAPVALEAVIRDAVEVCQPLARGAKAKLVSRISDAIPTLVVDRVRMVQVISNLLQNAIQHSPARGVVTVSARPTTVDGTPWVDITVEDAGPGFRAEDLPSIFEPFFTRRSGGTGLGLALAQRIVDQHGGRVSADNRRQGGAAVRVLLPLEDVAVAPAVAAR